MFFKLQLVSMFVDRNFKDRNLKVKGVRGQKPEAEEKEERQIQRSWTVVWTGQMGRNKTSWERTSSVFGKRKIEKTVGVIRNEEEQDSVMGSGSVMEEQRLEDDSVIIQVKKYEDN